MINYVHYKPLFLDNVGKSKGGHICTIHKKNIQRPPRNFPRSIYAISSIVYTHDVGLLDEK